MTPRAGLVVAMLSIPAGALAQIAGQPAQAAATFSPDPASTRLVIMPTARTLARGDVQVTVAGLGLPLIQVGITNRIEAGAGTTIFGRPLILTAKVRVHDGATTDVSVGGINAVWKGGFGGLEYAVASHGTENGAVTLGAGVVYGQGNTGHVGPPMLMIGGDRRLGPRLKIVGEAFVLKGGMLGAFAARIVRTHFAADLGVMVGGDFHHASQFVVGPAVMLAWRF